MGKKYLKGAVIFSGSNLTVEKYFSNAAQDLERRGCQEASACINPQIRHVGLQPLLVAVHILWMS